MKLEEYLLHYIWPLIKSQKIKLETTNGESIQIIHCGILNHSEGPDFNEAQIKIGDQLWAGSVEVHVKASDWIRHKHQFDSNYLKVILHVVYEADEQVYHSNKEPIPTLALKPLITAAQLKTYRSLKYNTLKLPCINLNHRVEPIVLSNMLHKAGIERLGLKTDESLAMLEALKMDWSQFFYYTLAQNFGFKTNASSMLDLARSVPLRILAKHNDKPMEIEAIFFGQAGLLSTKIKDDFHNELQRSYIFIKNKYVLKSNHSLLWKRMKARPSNYPILRISQFSHLVSQSSHLFSKVLNVQNVVELIDLFKVKAHDYWAYHVHFGEPRKRKRSVELGKDSLQLILINTVATTLFAYGSCTDDAALNERAVNLLLALPAERNRITKKYQSCNFNLHSALDSQGAIGLSQNYCSQKKCMSCLVGEALISG